MIRRFFDQRVIHIKGKLLTTLVLLAVVAVRWVLRIPCPVLRYAGFPCPGCGMTRALIYALRLDFAAAFGMHAMFWSLPLMYLYFLCDGKLIGKKVADAAVLGLTGAGFAVNWLMHFI